MRSIRRILVAVKDPASKTVPAVDKAAQLARAFGAELHLFHGITTPLYFDAYATDIAQTERSTRADALEKLETLAASLRKHKIKVKAAAEWDFPAYEAIIRHATQVGADLIVAERHATRHRAPGLLHLTDWELLRLSPVPVLLVKDAAPYRRPVVLAAVDPAHTFSKPAKLDDEILRASHVFTEALSGSLHAVHAYIPVPLADVPAGALAAEVIDDLEKQSRNEAKRGLDRALRSVKVPEARRHLVGRHPIDAIEQTAREIHSSIVVMGAISRSGLKRLVIGNTAESVLDQLTCDILIVKPAQFKRKVPRARRGVRLVTYAGVPGVF